MSLDWAATHGNHATVSYCWRFMLQREKTSVLSSYKSATTLHEREASHGSQVFEEVESGQQQIDPVGRSLPHLAATQQTTGEAVYIDDIRPYAGY